MKIKLNSLILLFIFGISVIGLLLILVIGILVSELNEVSRSWDSYVSQKSEKMQAVTALRQHLGYGGFIHDYKNYILRQEDYRLINLDQDLGAIYSAIANHRTYITAGEEERALYQIEKTLKQYEISLKTARQLVAQSVPVAMIDNQVKIDDAPMLAALDNLTDIADISRTAYRGKARILNDIRKAIGYGGMIHQFKNLVIRRSSDHADSIRTSITTALSLIDEYRSLGVSNTEQSALATLSDALHVYDKRLAQALELVAQGASSNDIDERVVVDDQPALAAMTILNRAVVYQAEKEALRIHDLLTETSKIYQISLVIGLFVVAILIVVSLRLSKRMIIRPIESLTAGMEALTAGRLDIEIDIPHSTEEIGQLTHSYKYFKKIAQVREKTQKGLRDREARVRAIVNTVLDGIITIDKQGRIETFNPAAERIFGYSQMETIGNNVKMLMPEPYHSEHDGYLSSFLHTGHAKVIGIGREVMGRRKDGSLFPMELGVSEMEIEGQTMFTGIVRDITERKENDRMKSEFVSTVSHELRTPLTSIGGALSLTLGKARDQLPEKFVNLLEVAHRNTQRLSLLVNDILDMEKLHSGQLVFKFEELDLIALLKRSIEDNQGFAKQHQVSLVFKTEISNALIYGDENRLIQVMTNLISNAVKYSPQPGVVDISLRFRDGQFRTTVADCGQGIPEHFRDRIFERFSQADSSDEREKGGTGLGLHISQAIIERHQGHIDYYSALGEGTQFYFDLPECEQAKDAIAQQQ